MAHKTNFLPFQQAKQAREIKNNKGAARKR
jgi:hypothetical protein